MTTDKHVKGNARPILFNKKENRSTSNQQYFRKNIYHEFVHELKTNQQQFSESLANLNKMMQSIKMNDQRQFEHFKARLLELSNQIKHQKKIIEDVMFQFENQNQTEENLQQTIESLKKDYDTLLNKLSDQQLTGEIIDKIKPWQEEKFLQITEMMSEFRREIESLSKEVIKQKQYNIDMIRKKTSTTSKRYSKTL